MKIRKMTAVFGTLENKTLAPGPGLNIIQAPNESGKSTWCAFIRAMLYGVDSSQRERGGVKPDKVKYAPWSGAPMSGTMDVECELGSVTLTRTGRTANAPLRKLEAVYTGTGQPVPGLAADTAGETLTGVPREVFERSAFIRQGGLAVGSSPELEKRIAAIVSTGSEETSFTQVEARLRKWQRARKYNRSGAIPELRRQIDEVRGAIDSRRGAAAELDALRQRRDRAVAARTQAAAERDGMRREKRLRVLASLNEKRAQVAELSEACAGTAAEAGAAKRELAASRFAGADPGRLGERAAADRERAANLRKQAGRRSPVLLWIAPAVLCVAAAAVGAARGVLLFWAAVPVLLAATAVGLAAYRSGRKKTAAAAAELDGIFEFYGVAHESEISAAAEAYVAMCAAADRAQARERRAADEYNRARTELAELEDRALAELDFSGGNDPFAAAEARLRDADELCARAEERLKAAGDPLVLTSELGVLEQSLAEKQAEYDELELAITTLRQADAHMQERVSPRLAGKAAEYFSGLTGGRYDSLTFSKELSARAKPAGQAVAREADFLSQGTADQLYLALRLALCDLALPEEDPCPIVLDDALSAFDDERMGRALDMLAKLGEKRQILLFTCHGREAAYLRGEENVTVIEG